MCLTASTNLLSVFLHCLWVKITFMFIISLLRLIKLPSFKSLPDNIIQTDYSMCKDSLTTSNLCSVLQSSSYELKAKVKNLNFNPSSILVTLEISWYSFTFVPPLQKLLKYIFHTYCEKIWMWIILESNCKRETKVGVDQF